MSKKGLFEEADGGTVFLDEIGDINPFFQIKLLRVLEEQIVRPVGSTKSLKVDIRVIAATNKDIADAVHKGGFREDLFYRINTITLKLPPLRERKDDIPLLIKHFLEKYSSELGKHIDTVSDEALSRMVNYRWPGNIRELQNVIERSILISDGRRITTKNLPVTLKSDRTFSHASLEKLMSIEEYTKAFIHHYQGRYNELQLSGMLGITRKSLWEKRKKWGIERNQA
jgi:two-component system response regulator PilR (NtrC family)